MINCFQYATVVVLKQEQIKEDPQGIINIHSIISHYEWKDKFSFTHKRLGKVWNKQSIAANVLFISKKGMRWDKDTYQSTTQSVDIKWSL